MMYSTFPAAMLVTLPSHQSDTNLNLAWKASTFLMSSALLLSPSWSSSGATGLLIPGRGGCSAGSATTSAGLFWNISLDIWLFSLSSSLRCGNVLSVISAAGLNHRQPALFPALISVLV